jgi:hypothetical protein
MRRPIWLLFALVGVVAVSAASADGDLERNRRLLEKWRADPDHYQRLLRDLKAFYALPVERQETLREIDRKMHEGDLASQARLWAVLDRYSTWLEKLPDPERREVVDASDSGERLKVIRRLREKEWVARLPARVRDEVRQLPANKRAARIAELRREERQQRQRARQALRAGADGLRPTKLADFPPQVQTFIHEFLLPRLSVAEQELLRKAEGASWPQLARTILELSERHPVLPPRPSGPITSFRDLPPEAKRMLNKRRDDLAPLQGRWPAFALEAARLLPNRPKAPPLGASKLDEMPREVQSVVRSQLYRELRPAERVRLEKQEGRWPEYPLLLLELARQKGVVLPGMSLPGPRQLWQGLRARMPDVPGHILLQFALHDLSPEDRAGLELSTADPMGSREKLKKAFYKKRPAGKNNALFGDGP